MKGFFKWIVALVVCSLTVGCQDEVLIEDNSAALNPVSPVTGLLNVAATAPTGCFALGYPLTVFAYNSSFQVENIKTLQSNQDLQAFLQGLDENEYYALDYPVVINAGGQLLTASDNAAFKTMLESAFDSCNIAIPGQCDNPGVLTDGLILYMTFSNSVEDLAGGAVSTTGNIDFVTDRSGNAQCALSFNGSQQLQVAHDESNSLVQGSVFSISVWFRLQNTNPSDYEHLFRKGLQGQSGFNLSVYDNNTPLFGVPSAQVWDNNWNADQSLWQDTNSWHQLAVTFDETSTARLYRDGVLQNTELFNADIGTTAMDYYIGQNFTGFLDDLRVYKKVLTAAEVQTLFELEGDCSRCLE